MSTFSVFKNGNKFLTDFDVDDVNFVLSLKLK